MRRNNFNSLDMKFEDIKSSKFDKFQGNSISTLKKVFGGWYQSDHWGGVHSTEIDRGETLTGAGLDGIIEHSPYQSDHVLYGQ
jgi:hypothetical protein